MSRLIKLRQQLQHQNLSSLLVFDQHNITYLSGFDGHAATMLITPKANYLLTDYRYFEQAKTQALNCQVVCRDRQHQTLESLVSELLAQEDITSLAYEAEHVSVAQWQIMSRELELQHPKLIDNACATQRIVEELRLIKDTQEIEYIRQAAAIADQALAKILPHFKLGVTEREMAIALEYQMSLLGSERPAFDTILLFGERSALPHGVPGERTLQSGDLILCDFGATVNGYRSDMTRTMVFAKADQKQKDIYQTVLDAQTSAIAALSYDVEAHQLFFKSQAILNKSPYAKYQGEGLGHGVGLDLHEWPFITASCKQKIQQGCVITIEPGIYIPNWGGVRIEDDVVLTEQGLEILTKTPKQLLVLE